MMIVRKEITLKPRTRGFHLITEEILSAIPEINKFRVGILNLFIKHTSASLTVNENADPSVRRDMERHFNIMVPEDVNYFEHTSEGPDDMTSHIKSSLLGSSVTIPVSEGKLDTGIWQGIYLCEHRNHGGRRKIVATIIGE